MKKMDGLCLFERGTFSSLAIPSALHLRIKSVRPVKKFLNQFQTTKKNIKIYILGTKKFKNNRNFV